MCGFLPGTRLLEQSGKRLNSVLFQNNNMYYLIRVPEKVFFAFLFFHLVLITSFFVYILNQYAGGANPLSMLK